MTVQFIYESKMVKTLRGSKLKQRFNIFYKDPIFCVNVWQSWQGQISGFFLIVS